MNNNKIWVSEVKIIEAPDTTKDSIAFADLPLIASIRHAQTSLKEGRTKLSNGLPNQLDTLRRDSSTIEWFDFLEQIFNKVVVEFYPRNLYQPRRTRWSGVEIYCMIHRVLKQGQPHRLAKHKMG